MGGQPAGARAVEGDGVEGDGDDLSVPASPRARVAGRCTAPAMLSGLAMAGTVAGATGATIGLVTCTTVQSEPGRPKSIAISRSPVLKPAVVATAVLSVVGVPST